ncbi:hypothetical protein HY993_03250, partial [Candidatus Micrarchaeota archaeon]|nr:hypothetical protein [Candidatus Micrarchaeota archaeon]
LYYFKLEPDRSALEWWAPFERQCVGDTCIPSSDGKSMVCMGNSGAYKKDENGNIIPLADSDRALLQQLAPSLNSVVIPNKLIYAPLSCGSSPAIEFTASGSMNVQGTCLSCVIPSVQSITKTNIGNDLSLALGKADAIKTTQGTIALSGGKITFFREKGSVTKSQLLGYDRGITAVEEEDKKELKTSHAVLGFFKTKKEVYSAVGVEEVFDSVYLRGDGTVVGKGKQESELGELLTVGITGARSRIDFKRDQRMLVISISVLAEVVVGSDVSEVKLGVGKTAADKTALIELKAKLAELLSKIKSNQALSQAEIELLRSTLNNIQSKPLAQSTTQKITETLEKTGVEQQEASQLVGQLSSGKATPSDVSKINSAINQAQEQGDLTKSQADSLKQDVVSASSPATQFDQISKQAGAGDLTAGSKQEAVDSIQRAIDSNNKAIEQPVVSVQGITIDKIVAKDAGAQPQVNALNRALEGQVLNQFETADKKYYFTTDPSGQQVLNVLDKKTGEVTSLKVNSLTEENGKITANTDKGPINIAVSADKSGQPIITVNGAGITPEIAALLSARGPNGVLFFDPATGTWQYRNGLDIPLDPQFGKKGLSFYGSQDGNRGVPGDDLLSFTKLGEQTSAPSSNPLLALPSVPQEPIGLLALVITVLLGAVFIRFKKHRSN